MTKLDKYNLFDRDCPFKEEWKLESDKKEFDKTYTDNIDYWVNNGKKGYEISKKISKSHSKK